MKAVSGFSKMSKEEKISWLSSQLDGEAKKMVNQMPVYWHHDGAIQKRLDEFSENTLTNFDMPFGIAPNFLINGKTYSVPMVIEESSVVAAASLGAKFWYERGGFTTKVLSIKKVGQIHFLWQGKKEKLFNFFKDNKMDLLNSVKHLAQNMEQRGGGVLSFEIIDLTEKMENYFQLKLEFDTCNAMGANFINSDLTDACLSFCTIYQTDFSGATLVNARFWMSQFLRVKLMAKIHSQDLRKIYR